MAYVPCGLNLGTWGNITRFWDDNPMATIHYTKSRHRRLNVNTQCLLGLAASLVMALATACGQKAEPTPMPMTEPTAVPTPVPTVAEPTPTPEPPDDRPLVDVSHLLDFVREGSLQELRRRRRRGMARLRRRRIPRPVHHQHEGREERPLPQQRGRHVHQRRGAGGVLRARPATRRSLRVTSTTTAAPT